MLSTPVYYERYRRLAGWVRLSGPPQGRPTGAIAAMAGTIAAIMLIATGGAVTGAVAAGKPAEAVPALPAAGPIPAPTTGAGHTPAWLPLPRPPVEGRPDNVFSAWLATGETASRALPHEHPRVLFVGDSITQWWQLFGRASWNRSFAPLGAADDGVVGDTTSNVLARIYAGQLPRTSPRVIVLMIGTNNLSLGQSPAEIVRGAETVMASLHARLPKSRMVVLGVLPRGTASDPMRASVTEINRLLRRDLGVSWASYVDVGTQLLEPDGRFRPGSMLPDLTHPSATGYALMSGPILAAVRAAGGGAR